MGSWFNYVTNDLSEVVSFFRFILYNVLPHSLVAFLFLFPAFAIVYGLVRYFHDIFK